MAVDRFVPVTPPANTTFAYAQQQLQEELTALWQHVVVELAASGVNAVAAVSTPPMTSYADSKYFVLSAPAANTGPMTLNIDGLGARALVSATGAPLAAGDVAAGQTMFVYLDNVSNTFRMASGGAAAAPLTYATAAEVVAGVEAGKPVSPAALAGAGIVASAGAADAGKYVRTDAAGLIDDTVVPKALGAAVITGTATDSFVTPAGLAAASSAVGGVAQADKYVRFNSTGTLDSALFDYATSAELIGNAGTGTVNGAINDDILTKSSTVLSAGLADAGKFVKLDATGKISPSVLNLDVMEFKGGVDVTAAAPAAPDKGDTYIVTTGGTISAGFTGLGGGTAASGDQLIFDGTSWVKVGGSGGGATSAAAITTVPAGNIAANNVQAALNELDADKLALAGGTMAGAIAMGANAITGLANPTAAQDAATKSYVDTAVAFTPAGNIAATTVAAAIAELDAEKLALAGGTMTGSLVLSADPTVALGAATKQYVDAKTYALDDLSDVTAAAPATNDFLQWNGTAWVPAALAPGGPVAASGVSFVAGGNIAATNVQTAITELDTEKAPIASPVFTGTPAAPTPAANDNSTNLATTAYVQTELLDYVPLAGTAGVPGAAMASGAVVTFNPAASGAVVLNGATGTNFGAIQRVILDCGVF